MPTFFWHDGNPENFLPKVCKSFADYDYTPLSEMINYRLLSAEPNFTIKRIGDAVYRGQVCQFGQRQGKGVMSYANGRVYEGEWLANKREGTGFERFQNGNSYQGFFEDNLPSGLGVYKWQTGETY